MRAEEIRTLYEDMYQGEKLIKVQKQGPEVADASGKHGWTVGGFQVHSGGKRAVVVVSCECNNMFETLIVFAGNAR